LRTRAKAWHETEGNARRAVSAVATANVLNGLERGGVVINIGALSSR